MPAAKRKPAAKKSAAAPAMSASQKTIFNKLKRKGLSDKQAHAFSKHAARRKDAAAAKRVSAKPSASKTKRAPSRRGKK